MALFVEVPDNTWDDHLFGQFSKAVVQSANLLAVFL